MQMTLRMSSGTGIMLMVQYVRITVKKQNLKGENSQVAITLCQKHLCSVLLIDLY